MTSFFIKVGNFASKEIRTRQTTSSLTSHQSIYGIANNTKKLRFSLGLHKMSEASIIYQYFNPLTGSLQAT